MELNKIYNEDCKNTMARMQNEFIDLTITSPPYNLGAKHHTGSKSFHAYDEYYDNLPEAEYQESQIDVLNELYRVTKNGGSLMYNHKNRIRDGRQISPYEWICKTKWIVKQEVVWFNKSQNFDKCRFYPFTERIYWLSKGLATGFVNNINSHDIVYILPEGTEGQHKRAFPLKLARSLLVCFPASEIIYDPYMGSGTTAIACIKEGRKYIGSEISTEYTKLAIDRIITESSQPPLIFNAA